MVELLINNAHLVGMVDEDLVRKTKLMSECFSTDDELDGSEDNLEESKETKRKEKKRKRSGSFQGRKRVFGGFRPRQTQTSLHSHRS